LDRLDRLGSLLKAQQETIDQQRERIAELERPDDPTEPDTTTAPQSLPMRRRDALTAGGLFALLVGGVGTVSADPQGLSAPAATRCTSSRCPVCGRTERSKLDSLHTTELAGFLFAAL